MGLVAIVLKLWIMPFLNLPAAGAFIALQNERMSASLDRAKTCKG